MASQTAADVTLEDNTLGTSAPCLVAVTATHATVIHLSACRCEPGSPDACYSVTDRRLFQLVAAHALGHWEGMSHIEQGLGVWGSGNVMDGRNGFAATADGFTEASATGNGVFAPTAADIAEFERVHP